MKLSSYAILCSVILLAGCSTVNKSQFSSPLEVSPTQTTKFIANVDAGPKIEGHASKGCFLWIFCSCPNKYADGVTYTTGGNYLSNFDLGGVSAVKAAAAYDAVVNSKSDIIIAPQYVIETNNYLIYKTWV